MCFHWGLFNSRSFEVLEPLAHCSKGPRTYCSAYYRHTHTNFSWTKKILLISFQLNEHAYSYTNTHTHENHHGRATLALVIISTTAWITCLFFLHNFVYTFEFDAYCFSRFLYMNNLYFIIYMLCKICSGWFSLSNVFIKMENFSFRRTDGQENLFNRRLCERNNNKH